MTHPEPDSIIERHISFFLKEGFWSGVKPDFTRFSSNYWLQPAYGSLFEEIVFSKKDGDREVSFTRDGMIRYSDPGLLDEIDEKFYTRVEKYGAILNALLMVVVSQITEDSKMLHHDYFELTHLDIISSSRQKSGLGAMGIPSKSATNAQLQKRFLTYVPHNMVDSIDAYAEGSISGRPVIPIETLERAADKFFAATRTDYSTKLLSRTNKALSEYASASFSDAVIICWTQVEIYLYEKMQEYAATHADRFPSKRKKGLRDLTSSETIELLEVAGLLNIDEYAQINKIRKTRNKIIHEGAAASVEDANDALKLVGSIITLKTGQDINLALGIRMSLF